MGGEFSGCGRASRDSPPIRDEAAYGWGTQICGGHECATRPARFYFLESGALSSKGCLNNNPGLPIWEVSLFFQPVG